MSEINNTQIEIFHQLLDLMTLEQLKSAKFNINHRIKMAKLSYNSEEKKE